MISAVIMGRRWIRMTGEMSVETLIETGTGTGITMGIDAKGGTDATTDLDFLYHIYLTCLYYSLQ
jgi:hypothetical protein